MTDVNDNSPIFITPPGGYIAMVPEDSGVGSEVIRVNATDRDQGIHQTITYSILSNTTGAPVPFEIRDPAVSANLASTVVLSKPHNMCRYINNGIYILSSLMLCRCVYMCSHVLNLYLVTLLHVQ